MNLTPYLSLSAFMEREKVGEVNLRRYEKRESYKTTRLDSRKIREYGKSY